MIKVLKIFKQKFICEEIGLKPYRIIACSNINRLTRFRELYAYIIVKPQTLIICRLFIMHRGSVQVTISKLSFNISYILTYNIRNGVLHRSHDKNEAIWVNALDYEV